MELRDQVEQDVLNFQAGGILAGAGNVAMRLLSSKMNINSLRTNDVLRKEEWLLYDRTVVDVARANLVGVADLLNAGLRVDLPNAFGTTVLQWEKQSDMSDAQIDMSGLTDAERDRLEYVLVNLPIPITHKEFQLNIRALEASRRFGTPLDQTQATIATRRVTDKLEDTLFNGSTIQAGGGTIPGYLNFASRNTAAVTASWATTTGENVLIDVLRMIDALVADNMYGPYVIYVSNAAYINLLKDFKANSDKSVIQRIMEVPQITAVRPASRITGTNVLMVQMTSDVVEMVVGFQPVPVMWETHAGMMINVKVLAIMVPRLKADFDGRCGIAHFS